MYAKRPLTLRLAPLSLMVLTASGCVRNTYTIPPDEAARIAEAEPADRARLLWRTRVVQDTVFSRGPACPAPAVTPAGPAEGELFSVRTSGLTSTRVASPDVPPGCRGDAAARRQGEAMVLTLGLLTAPISVPMMQGARFDGWGRLGPDHPVHVLYPDHRERRIRLGALEPQHLTPGAQTVLRAQDGGARLEPLDAAPLDRVGLAARMELGSMMVPTADGGDPVGLGVGLQLGYYTRPWLGFVGGVRLGFARDGRDDLRGFDLDAEVQLLPIRLGGVHLGLSAGGGLTTVARARSDRSATELIGLGLGGGLLGEVELATRIALSARLGVRWIAAEDRARDDLTIGAAIGLAVY